MKMKNHLPKTLAILLAVLLTFNALSVYAFATESRKDAEMNERVGSVEDLTLKSETDNPFNKIHFYFTDPDNATIDDRTELVEAINKLGDNGIALASTQATSSNANEIKITVQFESNYFSTSEYKSFASERENLDSIEEVREFRQRLNSYSKEYHNSLASANIQLLSGLEYNSVEYIDYSPYVIVNIDANKVDVDDLILMAESDSVVSVSLACEEQPESEVAWDTTLQELGAYNIVTNGTYTGEGIRIGIYESGGICDDTHINLADKNITYRNDSLNATAHATNVASILTAIAPDAEYYVSDVDRMGIQWFIDNACDIVNCSFGYYNNGTADADGNYSDGVKQYRNDIDGVYDYQIRAHFITVVKSAGNYNNYPQSSSYNPQNKVTSPGYAYNVITVGGVQRSYSSSGYYLEHDNRASYVTDPIRAKPNISAIYTVTIPNVGSGSGTSYASPQVAGCVALLAESDANYITYPERVLSVLMSTAKKTNDYSENVGKFSESVGAGVVDLQRMVDSHLFFKKFNSSKTSKSEVTRITVSMTEGDELQVGLAWLVNAVNTSESAISISEVLITDYDLRVYLPSGTLVSSALSHSNVEMLRVTAGESGVYTIVLYQYGSMADGNDGDWLSLTYNVVE